MDQEAFPALQAVDPGLLTEVVRQNADALLGAAWGLGWKGSDAEDLVQDVFVAYLKARERFQGRSSLKTYLFGILYNKSRERWRHGAREDPTDPIDQVFEERFGAWGLWRTMPRGPEDEALSKETLAMVEGCVQALPVQQRLAFYLREVEHESTENLCKILGVTVTHLGVLLFRARNNVRECVQKKWGKR